jgi:TIR domain
MNESIRKRRIFLIVADHGLELAIYADAPVSTLLGDVLDQVVRSMLDDDTDQPRRLLSFADCAVFDDAMERLPEDIRIGSIPAPGLLYVVPKSATSLVELKLIEPSKDASGELDLALLRMVAYNAVRLDSTYGPRLSRFLAGPDALFEPDPLPIYDAFVSFSTADFLSASNLALTLENQGVRCFLANTSISAGSLWNDELRVALKASRRLVLVASGQAAESSWVLSEIGAAWMLGLPIIVVPTGDVPWVPGPILEREEVQLVAYDDIAGLPDFAGQGKT